MEQEKRIKRLIGVLVAIIALLICIIVYLLLWKEKNSNTTYNNSTTTITLYAKVMPKIKVTYENTPDNFTYTGGKPSDYWVVPNTNITSSPSTLLII